MARWPEPNARPRLARAEGLEAKASGWHWPVAEAEAERNRPWGPVSISLISKKLSDSYTNKSNQAGSSEGLKSFFYVP